MGEYLQQAYEERDLAVELAEKHGLIKDYDITKEHLKDAESTIKVLSAYLSDKKETSKVLKEYKKKWWGVK